MTFVWIAVLALKVHSTRAASTCKEVKEWYRSVGCCGNPNKLTSLPCRCDIVPASAQGICVAACETDPTTDGQFPYWLGPVPFLAHESKTGHPANSVSRMSAKMWARVGIKKNQIMFKFAYDADYASLPHTPMFAMHMHHGSPEEFPEVVGHVIITIGGKTDLMSCVYMGPGGLTGAQAGTTICHEDCMASASPANGGNCFNPASVNLNMATAQTTMMPDSETPYCVCGAVLSASRLCPGGCMGDSRNGYQIIHPVTGPSVGSTAPSRACDIGDNLRPSDVKEHKWVVGKNSMEYSGNKDDADYSPYSIYIHDNYAKWCKDEIEFLQDMVLAQGQKTYVALHANFNATGWPDVAFGSLFASFEGGVTPCTIFGGTKSCYDGSSGLRQLQGYPERER
mmetsp:Transcript_68657/g.119253  ORF Transcript_68657/g.119253 Transcript_68657/m.119253 type:complete len:396 (+) Transcript_68657:63-1250(+)